MIQSDDYKKILGEILLFDWNPLTAYKWIKRTRDETS